MAIKLQNVSLVIAIIIMVNIKVSSEDFNLTVDIDIHNDTCK